MLRNSYFQSATNPTQFERLPSNRSQMEFLSKTPNEGGLDGILLVTLATGIASLAFFIQLGAAKMRLPFAVATLLIVAAVIVAAFAIARNRKRALRYIRHHAAWLLLTSLVFILLLFELPLAVQVLLGTIAASYLGFSFGEHWAFQCTTSPLDRKTARTLRENYSRFLILRAAIAIATFFVASLFGDLKLLLIYIPVALGVMAAEFVLCSANWKSLRVIPQAWLSWLSYQPQQANLPGIFRSPSGTRWHRVYLVAAAVFALTLPIGHLLVTELRTVDTKGENLDYINLAILAVSMFCVPAFFAFFLPVSIAFTVLLDGANFQRTEIRPDDWQTMIDDLRNSTDPVERESIYIGRNVADGSPLLVPRKVFAEHAHFLGDSGSGKTSLGLAPLIEQLVAGPDCSVVVIDLKADSLELYATLAAAAKKKNASGKTRPLKHFSSEAALGTFAFNPFQQQAIADLDLYLKTDILCSALGLDYGTDYGEGYFSSANAAVLFQALKRNPEIGSLQEAADRVRDLINLAPAKELSRATKDAGNHVLMVLDRLGSIEALNVTASTGHSAKVEAESIDLSNLFLKPQLTYFHLPSTLAPHTAPEIARLVVSSLLVAAKQTERNHPVYLVIDEFQRMVAKNLEMILQIARSMGVSVVLANQTMQDLRGSRSNLIPAIEGNCRYRQWFSVPLAEEREQLLQASGQTIETFENVSVSTAADGTTSTTRSAQQTILPRLSTNDLLLCSDHPLQSIVRIARGEGYAQLGGMSCIVESAYHISAEEYQARRRLTWPAEQDGTFVPGQAKKEPAKPAATRGPVLTTEVIGAPTDSPNTNGKRKRTKRSTKTNS